jgi:diapolycopene oxygenase
MDKKTKAKKVLVIGAGLGGLSAAISLSAAGYEVEVCEKNDKIGGKLNLRVNKGFSFDLGPSILTLPGIFQDLFRRTGKKMEDYVTIQEVFPHWRNFFEDGTVLDLSPDMRLMEVELAKAGMKDTAGFYAFLEYSRNLCKMTEEGYFAKGLDTLGELISHYGIRQGMKLWDFSRSMDQAVSSYIKNDKFRDILNYFIKYVGSSPYDSPSILNLMPYVQFGYGLWYVKGGMYNLARGLGKAAQEMGVKINLHSEVVDIETRDRTVTGIRLKDGRKIAGDLLVSNMEIIPVYRDVLKEDAKFLKRYDKFEPACSGLVLHLGVDTIYPQLAHHNFFYSAEPKKHFDAVFHKKELSKDPTIYLVAPVKSDTTIAPAGCEIIKVLPHIPHLRDKDPFTQDDYNALRERVLDKLERMGLKDLRKHIVVEDMWTPIDIQKSYYSNKGAIYGIVSDRYKNLGFRAPKKSEKYDNLYFVGGSVNPGGGMPMVTLSGQLVCDKIVALDNI